MYVFFIVYFFGLWIFITLNFALIERFLLPFHVYLVIFGAVFLNYVLGKLRDVSLRMGLVKFVLTGICLIFFLTNLHFQAHSLIRGILFYHSSFDRDLPTAVKFLQREVASTKAITVLASARRIPFLLYYLYDERENISFVYFRKMYQDQFDFSRNGVDFVILAPNDLFPRKNAFYNLDLLIPKGLVRQWLEIADSFKVSPRTSILKTLPGHQD